jgi:hypothetical protein
MQLTQWPESARFQPLNPSSEKLVSKFEISQIFNLYRCNEEASLMLAELMFQKEHYETAIYHFQQLLVGLYKLNAADP